MARVRWIRLLVAAVVLGSGACEKQPVELDSQQLRSERPFVEPALRAPEVVDRFYAARGFAPAWSDDRDRASLRRTIEEARLDGLDPESYHAHEIRHLEAVVDSDASHEVRTFAAARRELLLTDAFSLLASHLAAGRVDARTLRPLGPAAPASDALEWNKLPPGPPLEVRLERALKDKAVEEELASLRPAAPGYEALRQVVGELRRTESGNDEIEVVEANLERERWLPEDLGRRWIEVDLPAFELRLVEEDRTVLESRVVVGTNSAGTPVFSSRVEHVVLNPTWTVPRKILVEELAPRFRESVVPLVQAGFRVLQKGEEIAPAEEDFQTKSLDGRNPVTLVQDPGPANPLGRVKFPLPGTDAIYLHDSPARKRFEDGVRTFSHGCIRVEKAWELAATVLDVDEQVLEEKARGGTQRWLKVPEPVPVHVVYRTAVADENGLTLRPDPYGLDPPLIEALRELDSTR